MADWPYHYIRAYSRYVRLEPLEVAWLLERAQGEVAAADAFTMGADGIWHTVTMLDESARQGNLHSQYILRKIREYAGEKV
jgi:hypothetical protein